MINHPIFKFIRIGLLALALSFLPGVTARAQTNAAATITTNSQPEEAVKSPETLRSYLLIQEQLHDMQVANERNRQEAVAAANHDAELLEGRLALIEQSVTSKRLEELKEMQHSNRMTLIAAGVFALIAFVVLLCTAFLQWSAVNRLASVAATLSNSPMLGLGAGNAAALALGEGSLAGSGAVEASTTKFLGTIERLEKRIREMENAVKPQRSIPEQSGTNGHGPASAETTNGAGAEHHDNFEEHAIEGGPVEMLLGKGETLLKLDKPEEALGCFEEALAIESGNAEAMVRKGLALERLQRLDEAIVCYDLAIAADASLTMAYLYKGGVFNRMERYSEALECYEKALKSQEKAPPAKVVVE